MLEIHMGSPPGRSETAIQAQSAPKIEIKLEVVVLPVSDVNRAKRFYSDLGCRLDAEFVSHGVDVSEVFHTAGPGKPPASGRDPQHRSYVSLASFKDPDGNGWLLQEITALRRAEAAHGEHEKRTGERDADWSGWYAEYMVAEQAGKPLPT